MYSALGTSKCMCYLQRHGVRQSPDGDGVQLSVGEAPRSASQHLGVSAAVQLVSHLQLIFTHADTHAQSFSNSNFFLSM